MIIATALFCKDSVALAVVQPYTPPPPSAARDSVVLSIRRFTGSDDSATVSSGIPLIRGMLSVAQLGTVRLLIGGVEVPIAIRALSGVHSDGSLRSVHVQFRALARVAGTRAVLQLGSTSSARRLVIDTSIKTTDVAVLPVDPNYLIATELFGKTVPVLASSAVKYESQFQQFAEDRWRADGFDWGLSNYYDRAQNHFVYWGRSGDAKYWSRAAAIAVDYRVRYLEANYFGPVPHWMNLEGLALHYWLTGDESSRRAVTTTAMRMTGTFTPAVVGPGGDWREGRIVQRMLVAAILAKELGDSTQDWVSVSTQYKNAAIRAQNSDGSYSYPGGWNGGQGNFMVGLVNSALIKYYERIAADTSIVTSIRKSADYLWTTQWLPAAGAFQYASKELTPDPGFPWNSAAPDLNMLLVNSFAWVGNQLRSTVYRDRADVIARGAIDGAWLGGSKQFNQQFYDSHHYLYYRIF